MYVYIYIYICPSAGRGPSAGLAARAHGRSTANLRTKILDFGGFD